MAISFGPLMIACALFDATKPMFETWTKFTLGFAMIPLVLAGVMGAIMSIATATFDGTVTDATSMAQVAGGLIMVLCALFMMWQVPTFCTGLAGTIVAVGRSTLGTYRRGQAGLYQSQYLLTY